MPVISMFYGIIIRMYLLDNKQHHVPHIHCEASMYWDVIRVKPLADDSVDVALKDGRKGIFDLKPFLDLGVFCELKDLGYFNQVHVLFGALTWPHEQDIAPETCLAEMVEVTGAPA